MIPSDDLLQLIEDARGGDEASFERLLDGFLPQLRVIARQYADPNHATESTSDILQEAGLKVWQALEQFRGAQTEEAPRAMFRAWTQQIVHRTGLNAVRQRQAQKRSPGANPVRARDGSSDSDAGFEIAASGTTPSAHAQKTEQAVIVRNALDRVTNELSRRIVTMRFFDGLSLREISEQVGLGYEATRDRYRRAMKVVETALEEAS